MSHSQSQDPQSNKPENKSQHDIPSIRDGSLPSEFRPKGRTPELPTILSVAHSHHITTNELVKILDSLGYSDAVGKPEALSEKLLEIEILLKFLGLKKQYGRTLSDDPHTPQSTSTIVPFSSFLQTVQCRLASDPLPIQIQLQGNKSASGALVVSIKSAVSQESPVICILSSMEEQLILHEAIDAHALKLMECDRKERAASLIFSGTERYFLMTADVSRCFDYQAHSNPATHPLPILARLQAPPERDPFLIVQEPHHMLTEQYALYQGLRALYRSNHHWFGSDTVFIVEGVEKGTEVTLDELRKFNPNPSEETIKDAIASFLLPGHLAFLWAVNPPIKAVGAEDLVLHRASARISRRLGEIKIRMEVDEAIRPNDQARHYENLRDLIITKSTWHSIVFARNQLMAEEVVRLKELGLKPMLFVGFLHIDQTIWQELHQRLRRMGIEETDLWRAAKQHGLLTEQEVNTLKMVGTNGAPIQRLLTSSGFDNPDYLSPSSNAPISRAEQEEQLQMYYSLLEAQGKGAESVAGYIQTVLSKKAKKADKASTVTSEPAHNTTITPDVAATLSYLSQLRDAEPVAKKTVLEKVSEYWKKWLRGTKEETVATRNVHDEISELNSRDICAAFSRAGYRGSGYGPDREYLPNPYGTIRTLEQAIEIALNAGVEFDPEDYFFRVLPDEKFIEHYDKNKFAVYGPQKLKPESDRVGWKDLCLEDGRMLVTIRESVLGSDQCIVAIMAHECIEVEALRNKLADRSTVNAAELNRLTGEGFRDNLHWIAWKEANRLVVKNFGEF